MNINRRDFLRILPLAAIGGVTACQNNEKPQEVEVGDLFHNLQNFIHTRVRVTGIAKLIAMKSHRLITDDVDCAVENLYRLRNRKGRFIPILFRRTFYQDCNEIAAPYDGQPITVVGSVRKLREFQIEGSPIGIAVEEIAISR
jgi:hypothetical protein